MRAFSHVSYKSYQYTVDETNNLTRQSRTRSKWACDALIGRAFLLASTLMRTNSHSSHARAFSISCKLDPTRIAFLTEPFVRSLPNERFRRSEICARGLGQHFHTAVAIAISREKETSLSDIYYRVEYSVPVSTATRSFLIDAFDPV